VKILQIGKSNWAQCIPVPDHFDWTYMPSSAPGTPLVKQEPEGKREKYAVVIFDTVEDIGHLPYFERFCSPYRVLVNQNMSGVPDSFTAKMLPRYINMENPQQIIDLCEREYHEVTYGDKLGMSSLLAVGSSKTWCKEATYHGADSLHIRIESTDKARQIATWTQTIPYESSRPLEIWPQFVSDPSVEVLFDIHITQIGSDDVISYQHRYTQENLNSPIIIDQERSGYISCSWFAQGSGVIEIGSVHYRVSRFEAGQFIPGGRRIVDSHREELFTYFHPGNMLPPLNIYFSGYRPTEGFEGFYMMENLGHPFLLVSDPRLEGGRFYLGSSELEGLLVKTIKDAVTYLNFHNSDVIFSGLSMGTFGALCYGSMFNPYGIIVGKPIIDLEYVARRARLERPGEFRTAFDIVEFWNPHTPLQSQDSARKHLERMLSKWKEDSCFKETQILVSYMLQDDYDDTACLRLLDSQANKKTTIISRGFQGRHNDDNSSIVTWFINQYQRLISEVRAASTFTSRESVEADLQVTGGGIP